MSSILQVEFVIKELNVWSICDTNRIIRLNFFGKILQINENEIHSMCQNNKMLVVELQGGTIKAELSVIQELDSEEKVIGQCQFVAALIDSQIGE